MLLNYVKKEEATGKIAEKYKMLEERVTFLPNVVKMHTASPEFFGLFMDMVDYFVDHPTLDTVTIAYIRALISNRENCLYCKKFQSAVLKFYQVPEEDIETAFRDYYKLNLDVKRKALVCFVLDEMYDKLVMTRERIAELKDLGWTEKDIYEASMLAAIQKGSVKVINAFEVELDF